MTLVLNRIKEPDGIYDLEVAEYGGQQVFVACCGRVVKIYDINGQVIGTIKTPGKISKILYVEGKIFLIALDRYYVYIGSKLENSGYFDKAYSLIRMIYNVNTNLMIFGDYGYSFWTVNGTKLLLSSRVVDSNFYNVISVTSLSRSICVLAKTLQNKYIFKYSLEGDGFKTIKNPIKQANILFNHNDSLYIVDDNGLWKYDDKPVFLRNIINGTIVSVLSGFNGESSLLCYESGDVMEFNEDPDGAITFTTKLSLKCCITAVKKIKNILFFASNTYSYFVDEKYNILSSICCLGNVNNLIFDQGFTYSSNNEFINIDKKMHVEIEPGKFTRKRPPVAVYKNDSYFYCICYSNYSIFNGNISKKILNCSIGLYASAFVVPGSILIVGKYNYSIDSTASILKYFNDNLYFYNINGIHRFDPREQKTYIFEYKKPVFDFCTENSKVYAVLFDKTTEEVKSEFFKEIDLNFESFNSINDLLKSKMYLDRHLPEECNEDIDFVAELSSIDIPDPEYFHMNDSIYRIVEGIPKLIHCFGEFILNFSFYKSFIIVNGIDHSFIFDLFKSESLILDAKICYSFTSKDQAYICHKNGISKYSSESIKYLLNKRSINNPNHRQILYCDGKRTVFLSYSIDMRTFNLVLNTGTSKTYDSCVLTASVMIRKRLMAIGYTSLVSGETHFEVIKVKKNRLIVRKDIVYDRFILSIASLGNSIAVLLQEFLVILKIRNNKVLKRKMIKLNDKYCNNVYYMNRRFVAVTGSSWSFITVDLKNSKVKKSIQVCKSKPFILNGKIGFSTDSKLFFRDKKIEFGEEIKRFYTKEKKLYIFGVNGTVSVLFEKDLLEIDDDAERILSKLRMSSLEQNFGYIDVDQMMEVSDPKCKAIVLQLKKNF